VRTFKRHKTYDEIRKQCRMLRLDLNDQKYRVDHWDTIMVSGGGGHVIYNTFNGRFFGKTDRGVAFTSDETKHDKKPWMQAILNFFYAEA
jgi:hypothetical protein